MHGLRVYADDTLVFRLGVEAAGVLCCTSSGILCVLADDVSKLNAHRLCVQKRTREHCTSGNIYNQYCLHRGKKDWQDGMMSVTFQWEKVQCRFAFQPDLMRLFRHPSRTSLQQNGEGSAGLEDGGRYEMRLNDSIREWKLDAGNSRERERERKGYKMWGHLFHLHLLRAAGS